MRSRAEIAGIALTCAACAAIAGLDDPDPINESPRIDASSPDVGDPDGGAIDASADAPIDDADSGHVCKGTVLKADDFTNRPDAQADWIPDSQGSGTVLEIVDNRLHAVVPAVPDPG